MALKIGVVLSGCGVHDGSEITEAVSVLIAIDQLGARAICMAPAGAQRQTIDHLTNEPAGEPRNMLVESARIARGKVQDIASVEAGALDALVFPGGFGAAKNLCSFYFDGAACTVEENVSRLLMQMHAAGKPIGLACIAPVIAANVLGKAGAKPQLTIGTNTDVAQAIGAMGGVHHDTNPEGVHVDATNKLVTTPCYMNDVTPAVVFRGAQKMVEEVVRLAKAR